MGISIHAPPRGATLQAMRAEIDEAFQFTPLREGRRRGADGGIHMGFYFNSRPSARGDGQLFVPAFHPPHFNSRPSARGDPTPAARQLPPSNFNSRPSARGDALPGVWNQARHISIHAPPRGATQALVHLARRCAISIHAPPRGATGSVLPRPSSARYFNSRPSARGDIAAVPAATPVLIFQFTPLREGRQGVLEAKLHPSDFNSRPSARGDPTAQSSPNPPSLFQFTPLREGRPRGKMRGMNARISIHAPPRGATCKMSENLKRKLFQFTPLREGRRRSNT